jgi:hypothetical protein
VNNHEICQKLRQNSIDLSVGKNSHVHTANHEWLRFTMIFFFSFLLLFETATAQDTKVSDTLGPPKHSARRATLYSMALPGLGQAYNHKYWKIPVIYVGFGTLAYLIHTHNKKYVDFKEAYTWKAGTADSSSKPVGNPYVDKYDASQLLEGQNYFRRNLEVSIMFTAVLYILNVVDAAVDAHFFDYNVSDDLSLRVDPFISPPSVTARQGGGLKITLSF